MKGWIFGKITSEHLARKKHPQKPTALLHLKITPFEKENHLNKKNLHFGVQKCEFSGGFQVCCQETFAGKLAPWITKSRLLPTVQMLGAWSRLNAELIKKLNHQKLYLSTVCTLQ